MLRQEKDGLFDVECSKSEVLFLINLKDLTVEEDRKLFFIDNVLLLVKYFVYKSLEVLPHLVQFRIDHFLYNLFIIALLLGSLSEGALNLLAVYISAVFVIYSQVLQNSLHIGKSFLRK